MGIPSTLPLLILLLALVPGWALLWVTHGHIKPRTKSTSLSELISTIATGIPLLLLGLIACWIVQINGSSLFIEFVVWYERGAKYIANEPHRAILSLVLLFVPAAVIIPFLGWLFSRRNPIFTNDDLWYRAFSEKAQTRAIVSFQLDDGSRVTGTPKLYPDPELPPDSRVIVLGGMVHFNENGKKRKIQTDSVVIPLSRIVHASSQRAILEDLDDERSSFRFLSEADYLQHLGEYAEARRFRTRLRTWCDSTCGQQVEQPPGESSEKRSS